MSGLSFEDHNRFARELEIAAKLTNSRRDYYNLRKEAMGESVSISSDATAPGRTNVVNLTGESGIMYRSGPAAGNIGSVSISSPSKAVNLAGVSPVMGPGAGTSVSSASVSSVGTSSTTSSPPTSPTKSPKKKTPPLEHINLTDFVHKTQFEGFWLHNTPIHANTLDKHVLTIYDDKTFYFYLRPDIDVKIMKEIGGDKHYIILDNTSLARELTNGLLSILTASGEKAVDVLKIHYKNRRITPKDINAAVKIYSLVKVSNTQAGIGPSASPDNNHLRWLEERYKEINNGTIPLIFSGKGLKKMKGKAITTNEKKRLALLAASKVAGNTSKRVEMEMKKILKHMV